MDTKSHVITYKLLRSKPQALVILKERGLSKDVNIVRRGVMRPP